MTLCDRCNEKIVTVKGQGWQHEDKGQLHPATPNMRPNKNYVLAVMRDFMDNDPWGTAMAWAFACAENLTLIGADVEPGLEYRPSIAGPVIESAEDFEIAEYLDIATYDIEAQEASLIPRDEWPVLDDSKVAEVQQAAKILDRYLDWCVAAGKDY